MRAGTWLVTIRETRTDPFGTATTKLNKSRPIWDSHHKTQRELILLGQPPQNSTRADPFGTTSTKLNKRRLLSTGSEHRRKVKEFVSSLWHLQDVPIYSPYSTASWHLAVVDSDYLGRVLMFLFLLFFLKFYLLPMISSQFCLRYSRRAHFLGLRKMLRHIHQKLPFSVSFHNEKEMTVPAASAAGCPQPAAPCHLGLATSWGSTRWLTGWLRAWSGLPNAPCVWLLLLRGSGQPCPCAVSVSTTPRRQHSEFLDKLAV